MPGRSVLHVERQPHTEAELGVVLEQRVVPRGAAAVVPGRPRSRRQVGSVDRRAAGRIGDDHAVAEQLRDQLDVRRLATARARAGELEEWLEYLRTLDGIVREQAAVEVRDRLEIVPSPPFDIAVREHGFHVDCLVTYLGLALRGADVDAHAAARAIVGCDLDGQTVTGKVFRPELLVQQLGGRVGDSFRCEHLHADRRMRAHDRAFAAVDTDIGIPDRDLLGDRALLVPRG